MTSHLDGVLFRNTFGTEEMRAIVGQKNYIRQFLEVEAALARAEARTGLVPESAARELTEKASLTYLDDDRLGDLIAETGIVSMSIIGAWTPQLDTGAEYVHWGATSQDISDLAMVRMLQEALGVVRRDLEAVRDDIVDLADAHAATPMIGRTHYMHAIPITVGLKLAVWVDELDRHLDRLDELEDRLFVGQFFGATGTLASLGDDGLAVQANLADELDLRMPDVCWQAARDRFGEVVSFASACATTVSKIAATVLFLNRPEVGEASTTVGAGQIGSSTMPHKRNPKRSETIVALARAIRAKAHAMTETTETVDERSAPTWYLEFAVIPETFLHLGRILANAVELVAGLVVHPDRMLENMAIHGEFVASERLMMALADDIGRQTAHAVVFDAAMAAFEGEVSLVDAILADNRVREAVAREDLEPLADASNYTGLATHFVEQVIGPHR